MRLLLIFIMCAIGAYAETFNFQSTPYGDYASSLAVTNGGVTLTVTPEGFPNGYINVDNPSVALLGTVSVVGAQVSPVGPDQFAPLRFTFSQAVTAITFAFGDDGGDDDSPVEISAYDAGNNLLGTLGGLYGAGDTAGGTLTGTFADASYFILESGPHTPGSDSDSLYWEVPSVTFDATAPTPEPGTFLLLGAALFGVAGVFRSRIANR